MILLGYAILAGLTAFLASCYIPVFLVSLGLTMDRHARPWMLVLGFMLSFGLFGPSLLAFGAMGPMPASAFGVLGGIALMLLGVWVFFENLKRSKRADLPVPEGKKRAPIASPEDDSKLWPIADFLGGVALGMVWMPCSGALFRSILTIAETGDFVVSSGIYFAAYAFGVGVTLVFWDRVLTDIFGRLRKKYIWTKKIPVVLGAVMVAYGFIFFLGLDPFINRLLFGLSPFTLFAL